MYGPHVAVRRSHGPLTTSVLAELPAVVVEHGSSPESHEHVIELHYRPTAWRAGALLAGLTALGLVLLWGRAGPPRPFAVGA